MCLKLGAHCAVPHEAAKSTINKPIYLVLGGTQKAFRATRDAARSFIGSKASRFEGGELIARHSA
jgi:hypothetical protein